MAAATPHRVAVESFLRNAALHLPTVRLPVDSSSHKRSNGTTNVMRTAGRRGQGTADVTVGVGVKPRKLSQHGGRAAQGGNEIDSSKTKLR